MEKLLANALPPPPADLRWDHLEEFWGFIAERQRIWKRRFVDRSPPPWTYDPILQVNKFTNIYRELDPGTRYVQDAILEQAAPPEDTIFNVLLYRLIGRPISHQTVGFQKATSFNADSFIAKLRRLRDSGESVFTGAYMVSAYEHMGGSDKIENVARLFAQLAPRMKEVTSKVQGAVDSEAAYRVLRDLEGFGDFLAFQALVDLRYPVQRLKGQRIVPFSNDSWAKAGPGAVRGLRTLFAQSREGDSQLAQMRYLRDTQVEAFRVLGLDFPFLMDGNDPRKIDVSNIQNCLCEYYKYAKIKRGTGKARLSYEGHAMPETQQKLY